MSDPTDDKTYEGLTLKDYLRHFVPQVEDQITQIKEINELGFKPLYDKMYKETMPKQPEPVGRHAKRQAKLKQAKLDKKLLKKKT